MSYSDRAAANANDDEYAKIVLLQKRAEEVVQNCVDRGIALYIATPDANDKAELVILRSDFAASLTAIIGA